MLAGAVSLGGFNGALGAAGQRQDAINPSDAAEAEWSTAMQSLQAAEGPDGDTAASKAARGAGALAQAERFKAFYTRSPVHRHASEARKLEALLLIDAVEQGANTAIPRMESTVRQFRNDKKVPAELRATVAGTYEFAAARARIHTAADREREFEAVGRKMVQEFPEQPQGYTTLLTLAMEREDTSARKITREVADASTAPVDLRDRARILLRRFDLVGSRLQDAVPNIGSITVEPATRKPTLVYFWAPWNSPSIEFARWLGATAQNWRIIGICLDPDGPTARDAAKAQGLPGELVYFAEGMRGKEISRLAADEAPLLYLTDQQGVIIDVRGTLDTAAKLAPNSR